jgi:hypothetical protein
MDPNRRVNRTFALPAHLDQRIRELAEGTGRRQVDLVIAALEVGIPVAAETAAEKAKAAAASAGKRE